ncbi:hypothetical protein ACQKO5_19205 [Novosphingobium subterraneum]|uniref:hypothetical protein n=1 Tax=Novosphingobium subterraneum TaxID=48936 RepID=UPI003D0505F5
MYICNALMFAAVALLIAAQENTDGTPLMFSWHGLGIAMWILLFNAAINLWMLRKPKA